LAAHSFQTLLLEMPPI